MDHDYVIDIIDTNKQIEITEKKHRSVDQSSVTGAGGNELLKRTTSTGATGLALVHGP